MDEENPKAKLDGICRVTKIGPTGIEWICVKPVHDKVYYRRTSDRNHRKGDPIFSNNPSVDRHVFVNRWPNRKGVYHGHEEAEAGSCQEEA